MDEITEITTKHHPLSPSNYPAFYHCGDYEGNNEESDASRHGTACHKLYEHLCKARNESLRRKKLRFRN